MVEYGPRPDTTTTRWHRPFEHVPVRQSFPQVPQFFGSFCTFTHVPEQVRLGDWHAQALAEHVSLVAQARVEGIEQTPLLHEPTG